MFGPSISSRSRRTRSRFRTRGDEARDRQAWAEAAEEYRRHLLLAPEDGRIWIQLGHMLKENGRSQEALAAYATALDLLPGDADLLLHLGHAHLATGDIVGGTERLRESALAGNTQASQDIMALFGESVAFSTTTGNSADGKLLADLTRQADGLRAIDCRDIVLPAKDQLKTLSHDPWIVYEWEEGACIASPMALLTIEAAPMDPDIQPIGRIYVDIGDGFSERNSARFSFIDGKATILLVAPAQIEKLRFDPDENRNTLTFPKLTLTPLVSINDVEQVVRREAPADVKLDWLLELMRSAFTADKSKRQLPSNALSLSLDLSHDYDYWVAQNANPSSADYQRMREMEADFAINPFFSFVMPTYNTPPVLLRECLDSLLAQTYQNFEICIADDCSPDPEVVEVLEEYVRADTRVRYIRRPFNGHISAASNTALSLATGDYVVLVDHDDLIPDYALFVLAWYINRYPNADILYSDEDKVTASGQRVQPYFKSDFNKYLMYGHNMVSHLGVYRRSLVEQVGGFRLGLEGSQDYDLLLRCLEATAADCVVHIPHILYHWRIIPGSTAMSADQKSYAVIAAQNAINGHFERTGMPLRSIDGFAPGCTGVRPSRTFDTPMSIIIPTRNGLDLLQPCIDSIFGRDSANVEIIIVDNGSDDPDTLSYLAELASRDDVRILRDPGEFNFSRINNLAAAEARGEILCFLNNDTEVVSADWLNRARAFLSLDEVGMVGARLLFPDGSLQHFGIALGMGEHRIAGIPHLSMDAALPGYFGKARLLQEVSAVTAACMFLRKSDFVAVDGFDEELRVAYNDVDLCLKIRALGKKILVDPDITLIHKESRTRGSDKHGARAKRLNEEARWMRQRWANELDNDPYFSPNIDLARIDFAYAAKPRQPWPWQATASDGYAVAPTSVQPI